MKGLLSSIDKVIKVDDYTVHIKTKGPNPLLPAYLTTIYMMDKEWSEANNTRRPSQDYKDKKDNFAVRNANGTGRLRAGVARAGRQDGPEAATTATGARAQFPLGITEITYLTIKSDATRVAALLSGEVDFVQDVPVQDIERAGEDARHQGQPRAGEPHDLPRHGRRLGRAQVRPTSRAATRSPTSACGRP